MSTATRSRQRRKAAPRSVGGKQQVAKVEASAVQYDAAVESEQTLAARAADIRGDATELTPALFLQLWPLLREPIPEGFLVEATRGEGKPYDSKGIRSVQVCVNRMDAVLTPLWWHYEHAYEQAGKLCLVTVNVGPLGGPVLVSRSSYGGMNRGSTEGNLYKGTFTNSAKRAFAMLGPGNEIYTGAMDYEPDVNPAAATEQVRTDRQADPDDTVQISDERARELVDAAWMIGLQGTLGEAVGFVVGEQVGDLSNKTAATAAVRALTPMQAGKLEKWLNTKADQLSLEDQIRERNGGEK